MKSFIVLVAVHPLGTTCLLPVRPLPIGKLIPHSIPLLLLQDIREALPDLSILTVAIEHNDGRYKPSAKITLEGPEVLDAWPKSRHTVFVRSKDVSVCVGSSDGWLCVAKLPLDYSDHQFAMLAGAYGKVRECFLMVSEKTGKARKDLCVSSDV